MEKINIAELLKDCPKGMELYSPIFGDVYLDKIRTHLAIVVTTDKKQGDFKEEFLYDGRYGMNGECMIFPSKEERDWSKFQRPFKDGDILACNQVGNQNPTIYIYSYNEAQLSNYYIALIGNELKISNRNCRTLYSVNENFIRFATEKEKERLFNAIKENGCEWNAETKTLEKLIEPKFNVGDVLQLKTDHNNKFTITSIDKYFYSYNRGQSEELIFIKNQDKYELVLSKFDISTLKPFDKVLVWDGFLTEKWNIDFFGSFDDNSKLFKTMTGTYSKCIPYEGNEHLFDTDNDCDEFYKTW